MNYESELTNACYYYLSRENKLSAHDVSKKFNVDTKKFKRVWNYFKIINGLPNDVRDFKKKIIEDLTK